METTPNLPLVPEHSDFDSQAGIRQAGRKIHSYLLQLRRKLEEVFSHVADDVNPLYGELDYSTAAPASGAQSVISVTVPGAIPGYRAEPTYDQHLQGMADDRLLSAATIPSRSC